MEDLFIDKIRDFLFRPFCAYREVKEEDTRIITRYYLLLLTVNAILTTLISFFGFRALGILQQLLHVSHPIITFFVVFICGLILAPLFGVWLSLWIYLVGGETDIFQSIKIVMYSATPILLFAWIPVISIFFYFWSMILAIFGVHETFGIDGERASFAVIIAIIIPLIVLTLLAFLFFREGFLMILSLGRIGVV